MEWPLTFEKAEIFISTIKNTTVLDALNLLNVQMGEQTGKFRIFEQKQRIRRG